MNIMFGAMLGGWEIVLILAVVLILFGAKKIPELAKGLGSGIKEFKKATREVTEELNKASDDTQPTARKLPPTNAQVQAEPTDSQSTQTPKA